MKTVFTQDFTKNSLFLWIIHRFAEAFDRHAILKGGMALCLVGCPRSTNDLARGRPRQ